MAVSLGASAAALTLWMRWPYRRFPIGYDESVWAYIAQQTLTGRFIPYRDVIDNKPPLVYVPFFLSESLVGHGDAAVRATGIAVHVLIVGLLVYVLARLLGPFPALTAGAAEAVLGGTPHLEGDYLLQSEVIIELVLVLLLWAAVRACDGGREGPGVARGPIVVGGLCAAAFMTKQTHLVLAPAVLLVYFLAVPAGRRARVPSLFTAGFAIVLLALGLPFFFSGSLPDLIGGVFLQNLRHVVALPDPSRLITQTRGVLSNQALLALLAIMGGALALVRRRTRIPAALAWFFLVAGAIGVVAGGDRLFRHYFLLVSFPLHLLLACGLAALSGWARPPAAAGAMLLIVLQVPAERRWPEEVIRVTPAPIDPRPLAYLAAHRREGETVFFEWQPNYYETGLRAPHRYITIDHLATPGYENERDDVLRVLESGRITWIVTRNGTTNLDWGLRRILSTGWARAYVWPAGAVYRAAAR